VNNVDISRLPDDELLDRTLSLAQGERSALCDLVEHLAELDRRGPRVLRHYVSLFEYCVHRLRMSEDVAYRRIRAARAIRKFAPILDLMREGRLTLEVVSLLHPHLDDPDAAVLITRCFGLRKWQVQALLAGRQMEPAKRDVVRFCGTSQPEPAPIIESVEPQFVFAPNPNDSVATAVDSNEIASASPQDNSPAEQPRSAPPLPPKRTIRVSFSADEDFYKLMQRARSLLRHKYPDGRLEGVLKDALTALLAKKDPGFRWSVKPAARTRSAREGTRRAA